MSRWNIRLQGGSQPLTSAAFDSLEAKLGLSIHTDIRALYSLADGGLLSPSWFSKNSERHNLAVIISSRNWEGAAPASGACLESVFPIATDGGSSWYLARWEDAFVLEGGLDRAHSEIASLDEILTEVTYRPGGPEPVDPIENLVESGDGELILDLADQLEGMKTRQGWSLCEEVARRGRLDIARLLVARTSDYELDHLLWLSVPFGDLGFLSFLVEQGADLKMRHRGRGLLNITFNINTRRWLKERGAS